MRILQALREMEKRPGNGRLKALAKRLAAHDRIDMTECLVRTKEIEKLSHGGNWDKGVHLDSIAANPDVPELLRADVAPGLTRREWQERAETE